MSTHARVKKWGSSMAILIPSGFARTRDIDVGSVIDLDAVHVVQPKRRRYKLAELMRDFKPSHRHGEWAVGHAVGREVW